MSADIDLDFVGRGQLLKLSNDRLHPTTQAYRELAKQTRIEKQ